MKTKSTTAPPTSLTMREAMRADEKAEEMYAWLACGTGTLSLLRTPRERTHFSPHLYPLASLLYRCAGTRPPQHTSLGDGPIERLHRRRTEAAAVAEEEEEATATEIELPSSSTYFNGGEQQAERG